MVIAIASKTNTLPKVIACQTLFQSGEISMLGKNGFQKGNCLLTAHIKPVDAKSKMGMTDNKYAIRLGNSF
jgi:hypothetical protein